MKQYKFYTTVGIIETDDYWNIKKYVLHREDGPAYIRYDDDGIILSEIWYINGVRHREDGPVYISYHPNGSIMYEEWYWCGMLHRHDYTKPATTYNDKPYYYWYGVQCQPEQLLVKDFRDRIQLEQLG